jgi:predicted nucleic acid-binding protein
VSDRTFSDRTFVDTIILIYARDADAKSKVEVAQHILPKLSGGRTGVLSMQVLQEFYVYATRKIRSCLTSSYAICCARKDAV